MSVPKHRRYLRSGGARRELGTTDVAVTGDVGRVEFTTVCVMPTITYRPDDESARALAVHTADGRSASAAIRDALIHQA